MGLTVEKILIKMIKSIDYFENIDDEEALELSKDFKLRYYTTGTTIIREGEKPEKIYILKTGKLEAKKAHGLTSVVLGYIKPGEIFGEMSYLKNTKAMASVNVSEDSDVWEIPVEKFDIFLKKYPHIMDKTYEIMKQREKSNSDKLMFKKNNNGDDYLDLFI